MTDDSPVFDYFDSGGRFPLGQDPGAIERLEKSLAALWSRARTTDEHCPSVYRLALANLVVIGTAERGDELDEFASRFAAAHPSRVLLAFADHKASGISATLAASCRKNPSGEGVICWEKITLVYPPGLERQMASAVRGLLVGRIATVVVMATESPDTRALAPITRWADLLVTAGEDLSVARSLLYWDRNGHRRSQPRWIDRAWMSLFPLRTAIAAAYDDPAVQERFKSAAEIDVQSQSPLIRTLLAGWLVSRFDWPIDGPDTDHAVRLRLNGERSLRLRLSTGNRTAIAIRGADGAAHVIELPSGNGDAGGGTAWNDEGLPDRIVDALHVVAPDEVFLSATDAAAQLDGVASGLSGQRRVTVAPDAEGTALAAAQRFAQIAAETTRTGARFRVALAGGQTPRALYEALARSPYRETIPWERIEWYWGDERWVPHDHADSNYRMAREALLDHVPIDEDTVQAMPAAGDLSPAEAAEAYETAIRDVFGVPGAEVPRFDLILLGIGDDGHTASLFASVPLDPFDQRLVWGGDVIEQNAARLTLTPRTINSARRVMFLATGAAKAEIVARTLYPSWVQRHPAARIELCAGDVEWFLDRAAAGRIEAVSETGLPG